ncbi:3-methyl-2-oxobutanoate hydroxymethyltransferase [Frankia umida]|nr:3-methyl-2-oxobutanoate hydroxymethyltransferase [Frankia umida]
MTSSDTGSHSAVSPAAGSPGTGSYVAPEEGATTASQPRGRTRFTVRDVAAAKARGQKWAMLTAYDFTTAGIFDEAEIPVLLVGDSAANVVYGYDTTIPVTVDELIPLVRAVVRGAPHAMVVADLPFGSYQAGPAQALETATRFLKEGGAQAVKLEGGQRVAEAVRTLTAAGIPVVGHLGLTPQSVHAFGGYRVQGRDAAGDVLLAEALAIEAAGAFAVVLEVVPAELAARVTKELRIATVGIGAGADCDAQVLVWQDMAGLGAGRAPRFVKRYADLRTALGTAARTYRDEVRDGRYPTVEHSY